MSTRDIASDLTPQYVFGAQGVAITTNTTTTGSSIDTSDYDSGLMFWLEVHAYTDGSYQLTLQDSPDDSVWTAVPSSKLIQPDGTITLTAITAAGDELKRLGAFSTNRYVRVAVVSTAVTTGASIYGFCAKKSEYRPDRV